MKSSDVKVGGTYLAKVKGKEIRVRIEAARSTGGWDATNLATNLVIRIKNPKDLKPDAESEVSTPVEPMAELKGKKGSKKVKTADAPAAESMDAPAETTEVKNDGLPEEETTTAKPEGLPEVEPAPTTPEEPPKLKKLSAIDAAAKVLTEAGTPMNTKKMIETMATKGYWTSPGGKTPSSTLYSAILREIATKGAEARFTKTERGTFAAKA